MAYVRSDGTCVWRVSLSVLSLLVRRKCWLRCCGAIWPPPPSLPPPLLPRPVRVCGVCVYVWVAALPVRPLLRRQATDSFPHPSPPSPPPPPHKGTVLAKKNLFQTIKDVVWGFCNAIGLFFSTFSPTTREQRRVQALERRGARGGGSNSSSSGNTGGGGGSSTLRHRGANIHGLRQSSQATVPGGGCSGGGCG
jgi:hypothetical protein